jgi:hypothetical protein
VAFGAEAGLPQRCRLSPSSCRDLRTHLVNADYVRQQTFDSEQAVAYDYSNEPSNGGN